MIREKEWGDFKIKASEKHKTYMYVISRDYRLQRRRGHHGNFQYTTLYLTKFKPTEEYHCAIANTQFVTIFSFHFEF